MHPDEEYNEERAKHDYTKPPKRITAMRRFILKRDKDIAGVSGTGIIAEGVVFSNGKVTLSWLTQYKSVGVYDSLDDVEAIHCHGGYTEIAWFDLEPDDE
jgi:hypothetical protein